MTEDDELTEMPLTTENAVAEDLMDHAAALLRSQMRTAILHLRKRAARLLAPTRPARISPSGHRGSPID